LLIQIYFQLKEEKRVKKMKRDLGRQVSEELEEWDWTRFHFPLFSDFTAFSWNEMSLQDSSLVLSLKCPLTQTKSTIKDKLLNY
jgi:hypothetical protein